MNLIKIINLLCVFFNYSSDYISFRLSHYLYTENNNDFFIFCGESTNFRVLYKKVF